MIELDPELLRRAVKDKKACNPKTGSSDRVVIVDDVKSVPTHSGEIIQSGLVGERLIELGEIVHIRRQTEDTVKTERLDEWLRTGLVVVYKSVGVGRTDRAAGRRFSNSQESAILV